MGYMCTVVVQKAPRPATSRGGRSFKMRRLVSLAGAVQAGLLVFLAVGVAVASASPAPQAVYVAGVGGIASGSASDGNACTEASAPCATLAQGLLDVAAGGTVYVSGAVSESTAATVSSDVTLAATPGAVSAAINGSVADATGLLSVGSVTVSIQGITLQDGRSITGGAISLAGGDLNVINSTFTDDAAIGIGGDGDGGAIYNDGGTVTVSGSTFTADTATSDRYSGNGGAIFNAGGVLTVSDSTFRSDSATTDGGEGNGGAIDNGDGDDPAGTSNSVLTVTDSSFTDDDAASAGGNGDGGAIDSGDEATGTGISVSVAGSTFADDSAGAGGGAIGNGISGSGALSVTGSTFDGDSADGALSDGGAIDNADDCGSGDVLVGSSTFVANSATTDGGALDNADCGTGTMTIMQSTFEANTASPGHGGTIDNSDYGGAGTIYLAGNVLSGDCYQASGGLWTDEGYNAATDASCLGSPAAATDATSTAAAGEFGSLAANGGPTPTLPLAPGNPAAGLIPLGASLSVPVAVGAQPDATLSCPVSADQRGAGFGSVAGSACDAGAVQLAAESVSFTSSPPTGVVVGGASYAPIAVSSADLPVTFAVDPATTDSACAVNDGVFSFDHAGSCVIDANAASPSFAATQDQQTIAVAAANTSTSLTIGSGDLTAAVTAVAPGGGTPGGSVTFSAGGQTLGTADLVGGSASVAYSIPQNTTQTIVASYQGTADYSGSSVSIDASGRSVAVSFTSTAPSDAVVGGPSYSPTASATGGLAISYSIDAATTASACSLSGDQVAFVHAGACVIDAQAVSDGAVLVAQQTFAVAAAGTATDLTVEPGSLVAVVKALAPASGTPTGTVAYSVAGQTIGTADLNGGTARLAYSIPSGTTETITATYEGADDYTESSGFDTASGTAAVVTPQLSSTPTITAALSSSKRRSASGWWRTPVKVTFTCDAHGSTIQGGCPRPVILHSSGDDESVARTITTAGGASARTAVAGIKIDLTKPKVKIAGVHARELYHGLIPPVSCAASDRFSGVASCTVRYHIRRTGAFETISYTATATSRAGAVARATVAIHASR